MSLNVVDKLNALSGEIDSLLDFIASDKELGEDFEICADENDMKIETQTQLNIALVEYLLDGKMQDGTRVLDYYTSKGALKNPSVVEALKNSATSVFEIKKVLKNAYETYSLTAERDFCLIPLVKMVNLRGIAKGDFIRARVIEFEEEFYLLEIYDVISSLNFYRAGSEALRCLISDSKCAVFKNEEKNSKLKASLKDFKDTFESHFKEYLKFGVITTNKLADNLIEAFHGLEDAEKFVEEPLEYKFFDVEEFGGSDDFIQNAIGGFSRHNCIYDVGVYFDEDEGLYIIPFLGTFYKIFETFKDGEFQIEGAKECVKDFLKSDKVPLSVISKCAKKYENFLEVINSALGTDFCSTVEIFEKFKGGRVQKFSPVHTLYNSKIFSEILGIKEDKDTKPVQQFENVGRNDPCPCGSGKKFKKCCGAN